MTTELIIQPSTQSLDVKQAVIERYSAAAKATEGALCCSVEYDRRFLEVLPQEILDRDYGCGDPSRYVRPGETVLDLGSGAGKICFIASQIVGPKGRVIGVDMNDDMLGLARKHQHEIGERVGWHNVEFRKGHIQDLSLDLEQFDLQLREHPVQTAEGWFKAKRLADELRHRSPMVASEAVDMVLSNCVLNLVDPSDRRQLFGEVFRVLRHGGRAVISDIVSSQSIPEHLRSDPSLWSGCISGAFVEHEFIQEFERVGFVGTQIIAWANSPWVTIEGIEFRSITVAAYKPIVPSGNNAGPSDRQATGAVIYRGPWKNVVDDRGTLLQRGLRTDLAAHDLAVLSREPFAQDLVVLSPSGQNGAEEARVESPPNTNACCQSTKCC